MDESRAVALLLLDRGATPALCARSSGGGVQSSPLYWALAWEGVDVVGTACCRQPKLILGFGSILFQCLFLILERVCFLQLFSSGDFYGGKWVFKIHILQ